MFRNSDSGPLCDVPQSKGSEVLRKIPPSSGGRLRCSDFKVAVRSAVRLSSDSFASTSDQKDSTRKGRGHPRSAVVATQALVLNDSAAVPRTSSIAATVTQHAHSGTHFASGSAQAASDRLEIERWHLLGFSLSVEVVSTLLVSRRDSTNRIYRYTWKTFCK